MTIFDDKSISLAVAQVIAESDVPSDHDKAFAFVATLTGIKGVVTVKVNNTWKLDSMISVDYHGNLEAGIQFVGSWK